MKYANCRKYRIPNANYRSLRSRLKSREHTPTMQGVVEKIVYSDNSMVTLPAEPKKIMMLNVFYNESFPAYMKEIIDSEELSSVRLFRSYSTL